MATKHNLRLDQVLPHVQAGVINDAQQAIAELRWSDDSEDSANELDPDFDVDALSTPAYSLLTTRSESRSSLSRAGFRGGGLSPPRARRPVVFGNFDGQYVDHDQMAEGIEGKEPGDVKAVDGNSRRPSFSPQDIDTTELSRQLAGQAPQSVGPIAASSAMSNQSGEPQVSQSGIYVPARQSSTHSYGVGLSHAKSVASSGDAPNGQGPGRSQVPIILEDEDNLEGFDHLDDQDFVHHSTHNQSSSQQRPQTSSSTPPPIRNHRPNRVLVYDDCAEDGNTTTDDLTENDYESTDSHTGPRRTTAVPTYDSSRRPPLSQRNTTERRHSLNSDTTMRTRKSRVRGSPMSGVHGPHNGHINGRPSTQNVAQQPASQPKTATLTMNYHEVRTPKLNHIQMYQDANSSRLPPARQQAQRTRAYRSIENSMQSSYSGANEDVSRSMSRRRYSDDELSIRGASISGQTHASSSSQAALPDFFSYQIFQVVLHNPTTAHQLLKFSETRLCAENVEFLSRVDEYRTTVNTLATQMADIHKTFISPSSHSQINVNGALLRQTHKEMKSLINNAFPSMETVFNELQEQIETLVFQGIYPTFVRHQMALSATKALGSDRFKYQGLGDCFTLTDPNIADNPILYASDGFVKVTGYTRAEIIPRNCRFLQGAHTDRQPIKRLRQAIADRKESIELILNYKKNGDPFWNLLYVAPLYNSRGEIQFFIGGQVNCSTTIHNNVDVMKVLSLSDKDDSEESESLKPHAATKAPPLKPSARRALLKAFGMRLEDQTMLPQPGDTGMEDGVLNRMQGQDLSAQIKEFYTAYSKYFVVRASTYNIEFYSDGIVEMLNPANTTHGMIAGSEVFRFLGQNMPNKQSDYKNRVRQAMRVGMPTSTPLRLQTRRSAIFRGDEPFLAHWTPLKDEKANVQWVVIALAPMH